MKAKAPHWPLAQVQALVAADSFIVQIGRAATEFPTIGDAQGAVKLTVKGLTTRAFAHSVQLTYDLCDVYGVTRDGVGWYLKLCIDESVPEVAIISFHPLERDLRTNGGTVKARK